MSTHNQRKAAAERVCTDHDGDVKNDTFHIGVRAGFQLGCEFEANSANPSPITGLPVHSSHFIPTEDQISLGGQETGKAGILDYWYQGVAGNGDQYIANRNEHEPFIRFTNSTSVSNGGQARWCALIVGWMNAQMTNAYAMPLKEARSVFGAPEEVAAWWQAEAKQWMASCQTAQARADNLQAELEATQTRLNTANSALKIISEYATQR